MKILKLFCKIGLHSWNKLNGIYRMENGQLMADIDAIYFKEKINELIYYSACKSCGKIRIDARYKWKPGTKKFEYSLHQKESADLTEAIAKAAINAINESNKYKKRGD